MDGDTAARELLSSARRRWESGWRMSGSGPAKAMAYVRMARRYAESGEVRAECDAVAQAYDAAMDAARAAGGEHGE